MATTHKCPVASCENQLEGWRAFCSDHWRMIPKHLREAVDATWRYRRAEPRSRQRIIAHQAAIAAAARNVDARLARPAPLPGFREEQAS